MNLGVELEAVIHAVFNPVGILITTIGVLVELACCLQNEQEGFDKHASNRDQSKRRANNCGAYDENDAKSCNSQLVEACKHVEI